MTTEARKSLDEIVRAARSLAPEDQLPFIRQACAADQILYESVTREIRSSSEWADLNAPQGSSVDDLEHRGFIGERIGPYCVTRVLGEGGMGAVFLAERDDGQFEHEVAIKLVRRGLLSRHVQNRLRIERQILATLDHPNIAKLLDGGTTPDGVPYIVMEYIDGEPIDVYCDRNSLTVEERLRIFRTVCSAVHAAHQNLVVHRDLKPSNILVTRNGTPKLLDFGIAKLLDERQLMQTLAVTQADIRLMTPDHASPEQVRGDPITTASDVYVLAILLYELLTGLKPFARAAHRLADLERAICEQTPTAPSAALVESARLPAVELEHLARTRGVSLARLRRQLRGDLDNIVLMGLRKEPERRYASVEQLSADIDRYLQGQPIAARADAWTYRTAKFVRRHFIVVGLVAAFVASLIGFSVTTYVQSIRIEQERDIAAHQRSIAEVQRARAESIAAFMIDSFKVSDPSEARGNEIKAREVLDRGAQRVRTELSDQPELQAALMNTIGTVYLSLGLAQEAESLIVESLQIRRRLFGDSNRLVAESLTRLAEVHRSVGRWPEAQHAAERALSIFREVSGIRSADTALGLQNLGMILYDRGNYAKAEELLQQSLDLYENDLGEESQITHALDMLGRIAQARGDLPKAEELLRRALAIEQRVSGPDHPQSIQRLHNLATVIWSKGDLEAAEGELRKAVAQYERILGLDHPETADALSNLGAVLQARGKFDEAKQFFDRSLEINRRTRGGRHFAVGYDLLNIAILDLDRNNFAEAEDYARQALDIYRDALPAEHPHTASALTALGRILIERGRPEAAEKPLEEALVTWESQFGRDSARYAIAKAALARAWTLQGRKSEAEVELKQAFTTLRRALGPSDKATLRVRDWLRQLYQSENRGKDADAYFASFEGSSSR